VKNKMSVEKIKLRQSLRSLIIRRFAMVYGLSNQEVLELLICIPEFFKGKVVVEKQKIRELADLLSEFPNELDKKYHYIDAGEIKSLKLYEFLPDLRGWKKKFVEAFAESTKKETTK